MMRATRLSTSAIPENVDPEFELPADASIEFSTRHSIMTFEPTVKTNDDSVLQATAHPTENLMNRDSNFSDVSGMDPFHFWNVEDEESSRASASGLTPRSMMRHDPYQGVFIEVNNHSINSKGIVMYHVDIKGPDGILSTYTIRRRYQAFRNLHIEMNRLIDAYTDRVQGKPPGSTSADSVPMSPHSQSLQRQEQTFTRITLPPLPSAGVWTYLKRHDVKLVEQRKKRFQEILRIAIRHPATRSSHVLDTFLSVAPSNISHRGSSYVSLHEYSVPVFDRQRESVERRQRKMRVLEGRKTRTASDAEPR